MNMLKQFSTLSVHLGGVGSDPNRLRLASVRLNPLGKSAQNREKS